LKFNDFLALPGYDAGNSRNPRNTRTNALFRRAAGQIPDDRIERVDAG
jgi:hypothetical protein